jgi:hypothetical protein
LEDEKQLEKFLPMRDSLPRVTAYIVYNGKVDAKIDQSKSKVLTWAEFMALGRPGGDDESKLNVRTARCSHTGAPCGQARPPFHRPSWRISRPRPSRASAAHSSVRRCASSARSGLC